MITCARHPDGYLELAVSGHITREEIDRVWARLKPDMPAGARVRLLETIGDLDGIDISAMIEDLKLGLPMLDRIERAAIVADQKWIGSLSRIADHFVSAEVRTFELADLASARAWLASP